MPQSITKPCVPKNNRELDDFSTIILSNYIVLSKNLIMPQIYHATFPNLLNPGHRACAGCGQLLAARHVINTLGPNTIVANATGCLEVTTSAYPQSSWKVPWIHSLFENPSAIASGILAALKNQQNKRTTEQKNKNIKDSALSASSPRESAAYPNVVAFGGDGSTFDIGIGLISGMWQRGDNILYVCFDNGAYMNTGYQASGATPHDAFTTTTPPGKQSQGNIGSEKNMPAIALAHKCVYVATASVGFIPDLIAKVKKSMTFTGPKYLQIIVPCVPGWGGDPQLTMRLARLAQQTGLYPILEFINGELVSAMKVPAKTPPVEDFLKEQKRFAHLFKSEEGKQEIVNIQKIAEGNIAKYKLISN